MMNPIKIDKSPRKGLLWAEWATMAYVAITTVILLMLFPRLQDPWPIVQLRVQAVLMTLALWGVYRMLPCPLTLFARVLLQMLLLSEWYPETFEFNRILPNLDPIFATWEQQLFHCQPSIVLPQTFSHPIISELLTMGYVSYFSLMTVLLVFFWIWRDEKQFLEASFVLVASFMLFYCIFIALPVSGPQYYFRAIGLENAAAGVFPDVGHYFQLHSEALPSPGWRDGLFYKLLVMAHEAGERPTAAFPSSHIGITVVLLWIAWMGRAKRLFWGMMPFAVLMFFATFYLQAHYAIDAIAGIFAGTAMFFIFRSLFSLSR